MRLDRRARHMPRSEKLSNQAPLMQAFLYIYSLVPNTPCTQIGRGRVAAQPPAPPPPGRLLRNICGED